MAGHRLRNADVAEFKVRETDSKPLNDSQAIDHEHELSFDLDTSVYSVAQPQDDFTAVIKALEEHDRQEKLD